MARYPINDDEAYDTAREVLDYLLRERGITEAELAKALGLAQNTVSDRRRGRSKLTLSDIRRAALFFGVSPALFVEGLNSPSVSTNSALAA